MFYRTLLALVALALAPLAVQAQVGTLRSGVSRNAQLRTGEQASWTVTARANDRISATATSGRFDTVLELYDPAGARIASDDDGGNGTDSALEDVQVPRAGRYRLVVRSYNDRDGGAYSVRMDLNARPGSGGSQSSTPTGRIVDVGAIRDGEDRTEYLGTATTLRWTFRGRSGQRATLDLTDGGGSIDPFLELYAPSGRLVESDDDSGGSLDSRIVDARLSEDGIYVVLARDYSRTSSGDLTLSIQFAGDQGGYGGPGVVENPIGRDIRGRLTPREQHTVEFEGRRGDVVTVTLASSDFDPEVSLVSPRGAELARNDDADGLNSRLNRVRLPADGTYQVVVQAHSSGGSGRYVLHITR